MDPAPSLHRGLTYLEMPGPQLWVGVGSPGHSYFLSLLLITLTRISSSLSPQLYSLFPNSQGLTPPLPGEADCPIASPLTCYRRIEGLVQNPSLHTPNAILMPERRKAEKNRRTSNEALRCFC